MAKAGFFAQLQFLPLYGYACLVEFLRVSGSDILHVPLLLISRMVIPVSFSYFCTMAVCSRMLITRMPLAFFRSKLQARAQSI